MIKRIFLPAIFLAALGGAMQVSAQAPASKPATGSLSQQLAAAQLEMTNACARVLKIVNRPVTYFRQTPDMEVSVYHPGWFHDGAEKPDFNHVDIRTTQELSYAQHKYVTSDLNPDIYFLGEDLEFNHNTKWFYTDRSLPKRKLTEEEMVEINELYRVIGRCESEIARLQDPAMAAAPTPATLSKATAAAPRPGAPASSPTGAKMAVSGPTPVPLRVDPDQIPMQSGAPEPAGFMKNPWVRYGGYGVLAVLLVLIVSRIAKNRETWA